MSTEFHGDETNLLAVEFQRMYELLPTTAPHTIETDVVSAIEVTDDSGDKLLATRLRLVDHDEVDSGVRVNSLQFSNKPTGQEQHKAIFGLLYVHSCQQTQLLSTPILVSDKPFNQSPSLSYYRQASQRLQVNYDDSGLHVARYQIEVLSNGKAKSDPAEFGQVTDILNQTKATIPGIAYMGHLLLS